MSEDAPSLRRPLLFVSTAVYLIIIVGILVGGVAVLLDRTLATVLPYGIALGAIALPAAWWISGRGSGFDGFDPSNLAFLVGVGGVAVAGLRIVSAVGLDGSTAGFLGLVVAAIVIGRLVEGFTEDRFGEYWGAEVDPDSLATEAEAVADESDTADERDPDTGTATRVDGSEARDNGAPARPDENGSEARDGADDHGDENGSEARDGADDHGDENGSDVPDAGDDIDR